MFKTREGNDGRGRWAPFAAVDVAADSPSWGMSSVKSRRQISSLVFVALTAGAVVGCASITPMQERRERQRAALDSLVVALESLQDQLRSSWTKDGGEVNPLGEVEPVRFRRIGWAVESIPDPYSDAVPMLTIACGQMPPPLIVSVHDAPRLDGLSEGAGQARIDDGPRNPIKWEDAGSLRIAAVLAGAERLIDPRFVDLRDPLQAGDTLTVSAPTTVGTIFFRFVLEGLEAQTAQCSVASPEVVKPDTLAADAKSSR